MAFNKQSVIKHPLARSERLLIENIDDETVIYDEDSKSAHALKPLAAAVFTYSDGKNSLGEIAELASYRLGTTVTEAQVSEAVAELDSCALLDAPELENGISRRDALKRFGAVGVAAGAGTMLISSIAAPMALAVKASSGNAWYCGYGAEDIFKTNDQDTGWFQPPAADSWYQWIGLQCGGSSAYTGCAVNGKTIAYSGSISGNRTRYESSGGATFPGSTNGPNPGVCAAGDFCYQTVGSGSPTYNPNITSQSACTSSTYCEVGSTFYYGVPSGSCSHSSGAGFCVDGDDNYVSSSTQSSCVGSGSHRTGNTWVSRSGNSFSSGTVTATWVGSTGGTPVVSNVSTATGSYVGVPCDGSLGYACAEVACVPNNTNIPGAYPQISGPLVGANMLNQQNAFFGAYSTVGEYASLNFPSKYCTGSGGKDFSN